MKTPQEAYIEGRRKAFEEAIELCAAMCSGCRGETTLNACGACSAAGNIRFVANSKEEMENARAQYMGGSL